MTYHPDPILNAALTRQTELQQEIDKLADFISTYRALAKTLSVDTSGNLPGTNRDDTSLWMTHDQALEGAVATAASTEKREAEANQDAAPRRTRVTDNPKPADVVKVAVEVIRAAGAPMSRRDIWEALIDRGMEVKGADPVKTLGTMLWRSGSDALDQIQGRGYWPKGDPAPPLTLSEMFSNRTIKAPSQS